MCDVPIRIFAEGQDCVIAYLLEEERSDGFPLGRLALARRREGGQRAVFVCEDSDLQQRGRRQTFFGGGVGVAVVAIFAFKAGEVGEGDRFGGCYPGWSGEKFV